MKLLLSMDHFKVLGAERTKHKLQGGLTRVRIYIEEENDFYPVFDQPKGYRFSVEEGQGGKSVGHVKVRRKLKSSKLFG